MNYNIVRPPLHKNFELPSRDELLEINPGKLVKIVFQAGSETPERMWVKVTEKANDSEWQGILDNDPEGKLLKQSVKVGDIVTFHPSDIIQIYTEAN